MAAQAWTPYDKLTTPPTNLKEAIDWVLRVTGRDGKKNEKPTAPKAPAGKDPAPHCLCFLAKAVKDLLYDARSPGSPGPSPKRYWDGILLNQEKDIVNPVLTDLGLLSGGISTTCAGGTEVIRALIDHLAQGLQKWVGWQEGENVFGPNITQNGIARKWSAGSTEQEYRSSYDNGLGSLCTWTKIVNGTTGAGGSGSAGSAVGSADLVKAAHEVHLLARIFLGSVCLIWSGLSQLGFLTKEGGGVSEKRWSESSLHDIKEADKAGLGSFMAAMGYDLDRLNGSGTGSEKKGEDLWKLLSGQAPSDEKNRIKWQEFASVKGANQESVAEYYSSIYEKAEEAVEKDKKTEDICTKYPLLVLHILASGYFRAGSAGAKGITTPASPAKPAPKKEENPSPRKPRTIREILYWLSALPYSKGYSGLVSRMQSKMDGILPKEEQKKGQLQLHGESQSSTTLCKDKITHYLTAACGYCPLVLIGIQGTIDITGAPAKPSQKKAEPVRCDKHKEKRNHRCDPKEIDKTTAPAAPAAAVNGELQPGEVCYGGYHLEVSKFGPLHGMYANGLFGFQMDMSSAQCLDQLRIYVYHCFYQLYFLRKQCSTGVVEQTVLGWKSCRYGSGVAKRANDRNTGTDTKKWMCEPLSNGGDNKCKCKESESHQSPLMSFLCDSATGLHCGLTTGKSVDKYPSIEDHLEAKKTVPPEHFGKPPMHCPVPMGWQSEASGSTGSGSNKENHFKDMTKTHKTLPLDKGRPDKYPVHCTGRTLSHLLEYYCDPEKCHGALVVLLRLLACITPTVPRTLGDLFGFYYYIVYIGGKSGGVGQKEVNTKLTKELQDVRLSMLGTGGDAVVTALGKYGEGCNNGTQGTLKCLYKCDNSGEQCSQYLCPLSGQQYGQLSPAMAGTYLSWLVYLIEGFKEGLKGLRDEFTKISCKDSDCKGAAAGGGCGGGTCTRGNHGVSNNGCCCESVVSCTGVLPVLYKYGFGYGNVTELHKGRGADSNKKCHDFLGTLTNVEASTKFKELTTSINQLIYTTRLPWIFVLTLAWLVALLYLAFGAIWPLDWTHMRSHCRGWFRKGSLSPWEVLMVGKKKGRGILEFFGGR